VQAIDDLSGRTLAAASTVDKALGEQLKEGTGNRDAAAAVGKAIAERLRATGVEQVVFDRGGNRYHGRVKSLADGAREGGLKF
jgi:large subunit ribosomal protein L18